MNRISRLFPHASAMPFVVTVLLASGCRPDAADTPRQLPGHDMAVSERETSALPIWRLEDVRPLCPEGNASAGCSMGKNGYMRTNHEGQVVAYDVDAGELRVIDQGGGGVQPIGGVGEGPGEYRMILQAGFDAAGGVLAFDPVQRRLLHYPGHGAAVTTKIEFPSGFLASGIVAGRLIVVGSRAPEKGEIPDSLDVEVMAFDPDGASERLGILPMRVEGRGAGQLRKAPAIFEAQPKWVVAPGGQVVHADGVSGIAKVFGLDGSPLMRIGTEALPRAVTDAEFERELEARLAKAGSGPMGRALRQQASRRVANQPGVTDVVALENGQIWLRQAPSEAGDSVVWLVFEADGGNPKRVQLPTSTRLLASGGDLVVAEWGSGGSEREVRWARLVPAAGVSE